MMIKARKDIPSGTIVLNSPQRHNALSRAAIRQLRQAFEDFHGERLVRAVILTGSGETFCSGTDLSEINESLQEDEAMLRWQEDTDEYRQLLETMLRFPKPIIAALNGSVFGSGMGLALASDLVIAQPDTQWGFPEPRRGLVANQVSPLLVFRIGASQAAKLLMTGAPIDAETALRIGLAHEVVPHDLIWVRANELAIECSKNAPQSLQLTKQLLNETIGENLLTWLSIGSANTAAARTTEAASEGVRAFLEKREPDWF